MPLVVIVLALYCSPVCVCVCVFTKVPKRGLVCALPVNARTFRNARTWTHVLAFQFCCNAIEGVINVPGSKSDNNFFSTTSPHKYTLGGRSVRKKKSFFQIYVCWDEYHGCKLTLYLEFYNIVYISFYRRFDFLSCVPIPWMRGPSSYSPLKSRQFYTLWPISHSPLKSH